MRCVRVIHSVESRRFGRTGLRMLVVFVVVVVLAACSEGRRSAVPGAGDLTHSASAGATIQPPAEFVGIVGPSPSTKASGALVVARTATGKAISELLPDPWHGMSIAASWVDARGQVWVTLASGPTCSNPMPSTVCVYRRNSCKSQVVRIDPVTDAVESMLAEPDTELLAQAAPSPNGQMLAYTVGPCNRSYFNDHIEVRDLATSRSWSIGAELTVCHGLGGLSWTADNQHLAMVYAPSLVTGTPSPGYGVNECLEDGPSTLAVVPSTASAPLVPGSRAVLDPLCSAEAVTTTNTGYAVIEACSANAEDTQHLYGPGYLLRFDFALHRTARYPLGKCLNGAELASDPSGMQLLASSYQFCNPPGTVQPHTLLFRATSGPPARVLDTPGGRLTPDAISW